MFFASKCLFENQSVERQQNLVFYKPYVYHPQHCNAKLVALNLLTELSKFVTADIILDRILPYVVMFISM